MAQRSYSPPAVSPLRFRTQLVTITLVFLLSSVLAVLPHTPHTPYAAYSTELYALDSAEAALPQYNSVRESKWQPSEDDAFDDDDDLESSVSAEELEPINDISLMKYKTIKLAVLLPYNMSERNYVFRNIAMLSATSAVKLAVEDINRAKILPVNMSMKSYDSKPPEDNPFSGSNAMLQASMFVTNNVSGVIGDAFSWLTEYSAMLTSALWIPQCSFSATSDSLNDEKLYATFFRTVTASGEQGQMMAAYIQKMGWRRVSVLYSDDSYGRSLARIIEDEAATYGLRVLRSEPIYPTGGNVVDINNVLATLQDAGSYINIIMATDVLIFRALEEIQLKGMFKYPYVWIVINDVYADIQNYFSGPNRPPAASFDGLVMFDPHYVLKNDAYNNFKQRWMKLDPLVYEGAGPDAELTDFNIRSYSCTWMIALCYQKDIENARARGISDATILDELLLGSYPRTIGNITSKLFSSISYDGPAGLIELNNLGNAINLPSMFFQIQKSKLELVATTGSSPDGSHRPVQITGTHIWPGVPVPEIPKDAPNWAFQNIAWDEGVAKFMYVVVAIGVAESVVLIGVVLWQRHSPVIKTASVLFSILELLGVIALYSTVLLRIGVFSDLICTVSPFMFSLGFALLIGSLAVKTLREYRLHNNVLQHCHTIRDRKLIKQLVIIFIVFMIPAAVYVAVVRPRVRYIAVGDDTDAWVCMRSQNLPSGAAEAVVIVIWFVPFPFTAAASAYLAGRTRDTLTTWNESRLIRYTMYNFLLYFVIFIPTVFLDDLHFRVSLMVQNIATLFALQACLLILFGPKIFQMWRLHIEKSQSLKLSQSNSGDPSSSPSNCTPEEQRRYELAMSQYGFLCSGKQGAQPAPRRRRTTAVMGRKPSMERQILFFMEPTLKGPAAYTCMTGTLNGPDSNLNHLSNETQMGQRSESQGLTSVHSDDMSMQRKLSLETEDSDDDAIPVLNETHWWFLRALRQWRPMRVVVAASLNLVILADDTKATVETCLYSSVMPVTNAGHYYMRIHCLEQKSLLLEFNSEEARDQWIQAFELPTDEMRVNNTICAGPAASGANSGALSRAQLEEMYQEMYQHRVGQNTTTHPLMTHSFTL
ncbi:hypothetical protein BGZ93_004008 [Podila epicladia]|nr:hypothetical protein BGZ92_010277 [Podila epicladia]KAG0096778.1 hypothetical protein BGZ93_004008 [Podila epicladia]